MYSKKAAMFGLDARIALAIFGALSVISGAALYSAIQESKTIKYQQTFEEMTKAIQAYYLDNYKNIPQNTSKILYSSDILQNRENLSTWKGPYFDNAWFADDISFKSPNTNFVFNDAIELPG